MTALPVDPRAVRRDYLDAEQERRAAVRDNGDTIAAAQARLRLLIREATAARGAAAHRG